MNNLRQVKVNLFSAHGELFQELVYRIFNHTHYQINRIDIAESLPMKNVMLVNLTDLKKDGL